MLHTPMTSPELPHSLLDPPSYSYSRDTVRRALAVWLYCGQRNSFRAVCDYYHRLEALEDQLSEDRRQVSRHPEMELFTKQPPTSEYLKQNYPTLYAQTDFDHNYLQKLDALKYGQDLKIDGNTPKPTAMLNSQTKAKTTMYTWQPLINTEIKRDKNDSTEQQSDSGATKQEILDTSQMIGKFCKNSKIALKTFLEGFKEHAVKCQLKDTVLNVGFYIKRKMIHDEMIMNIEMKNFPNLKNVSGTPDETKTHILQTPFETAIKTKSNTYADATKCEEKESKKVSKRHESAAELLEKSLKSVKAEKCDAENMTIPVRLLKRGSISNAKTGFQNNFGKVDTSKFRKI